MEWERVDRKGDIDVWFDEDTESERDEESGEEDVPLNSEIKVVKHSRWHSHIGAPASVQIQSSNTALELIS
jgi:hypothetical protein